MICNKYYLGREGCGEDVSIGTRSKLNFHILPGLWQELFSEMPHDITFNEELEDATAPYT